VAAIRIREGKFRTQYNTKLFVSIRRPVFYQIVIYRRPLVRPSHKMSVVDFFGGAGGLSELSTLGARRRRGFSSGSSSWKSWRRSRAAAGLPKPTLPTTHRHRRTTPPRTYP